MSQPKPQSQRSAYLIAIVLVVLATVVRLLLAPALGDRQPYVSYYLAILFVALQLGARPALLTAALSTCIGTLLFVIPDLRISSAEFADLVALFTFLLMSLAVIWLCQSYRTLLASFETVARQRHRAEDAERRQRERLEAILTSLGEGVLVAGADGRVVKMNPIAEQLTGWPAAEAIGQPLERVFHTRDRQTTRTAELPLAEILDGGIVHRTGEPALLRRRDGSELPIEASTAAIQDQGQGGVVVVLRDVSERLRVEEAERADRERLRLALEAGRFDAWDWDLRSGTVEWSENDLASYCLPPGSFDGTFDGFRSLVHPEDRATFDERLRRAIEGGGPYEAEFRVRRPDGSVFWLSDRGVVIRDDEGRAVRMIGVSIDVTGRKRDEAALRASEQHFRLLADAVPQIVWTAEPDGRVLSFNRRWYDYAGIDPDEPGALGRWPDAVHPDDTQPTLELWEHAYTTGTVFEAEYRLRDRDGAYRWHLGRAVPVRDPRGRITRWIGSGTDIDDRKRAERTLHLLADAGVLMSDPTDLEGTIRRIPELVIPGLADSCVVYLLEPDGSIRRAAIAHHDPEMQQTMAEVLAGSEIDPDGPSPVAAVLRSGTPDLRTEIDPKTIERLLPGPATRERFRAAWPTSHLIVPMIAAGRTIGAFGLAMTDSDRRFHPSDLPVAEDLTRRAAIALENARLYEELRENDRRKTEFLAVLAHELRNPLAPIRTALELLKLPGASRAGDGDPEAEEREAIRAMASSQVAHMARLIEDLMDVTRISRGTIELRREPVELAAVARKVVSAVGTQVAETGQALSLTFPDAPLWVDADAARIEQILWNLLNNASKYSDPGGRIALEVAPDDDRALIRVRDTGIGIDPESLAQIFDLFVQADQGPGRHRGGLGIGLSLVRMLVELHGGSIQARSAGLGQGSEFLVHLPRIAPPAGAGGGRPGTPAGAEAEADAGRTAEPGPDPAPAESPSRRILLVDDNRDAAVTLGKLLGKLGGHEVRLAFDGPEALRLAEAFEPEVVLLDIGLPGMDGYEVARQLRETPAGTSALLIALTGWGQQDDYRRSREAGFDHHLVKPIDSDAIEELLAPADSPARTGPNP